MSITTATPVKLHQEQSHVSSIEKGFKDVASFTRQLAGFEATPFLLGGIMLASGKGQSDIAQVGRGMGKVAIIASPLIYALKIIALPVLAASVVATGATGIVYAADKIIDKIKEPPEAEKNRIEHTQHFVQRMKECIKDFDEEKKAAAHKHPGTIVSLSLLTVVFLSRSLEGDQIKDGDKVIHPSEVEKMDEKAQEYFKRVCRMKQDVKDLNLSNMDDDHAWAHLNTSIDNFYHNKDSLQQFEQATLQKLIKECDDLTKLIVDDEIFLKIWNKT